MTDADRRFRVHPLWRQQWERNEDSPYQRLSEPDIAWRFAREIYRKDPAAAVDDDALDIGFGDGASRLVEKVGNTVGRVDEPGSRLVAQDREHGSPWDRSSISRESAREPGLIPAAPKALRPAEVRPADLSIRERIGNAAVDIGARLGAGSSTQQYLNRQATELADFVPGLNFAVGLNDAGRQIKAGNLAGGAAELGVSAVGILPGVGMVMKKGAKEIRLGGVFSDPARMQRAEDLGFRLDQPLYHGTDRDFRAFDLSKGGHSTHAISARHGVFSALDPETAGSFAEIASQGASRNWPRILPLIHRSKKQGVIDLQGDERDHEVAATLAQAWDEGFDAILVRNYTTPNGGKDRVLVVRDPAQLRSIFAKFDPKNVTSDDLLAGIIPLGPLGFGVSLDREREGEDAAHEDRS